MAYDMWIERKIPGSSSKKQSLIYQLGKVPIFTILFQLMIEKVAFLTWSGNVVSLNSRSSSAYVNIVFRERLKNSSLKFWDVPTKEDSDMVTCILTLAKFCNREIVRLQFNTGKLKEKSLFFNLLKRLVNKNTTLSKIFFINFFSEIHILKF